MKYNPNCSINSDDIKEILQKAFFFWYVRCYYMSHIFIVAYSQAKYKYYISLERAYIVESEEVKKWWYFLIKNPLSYS